MTSLQLLMKRGSDLGPKLEVHGAGSWGGRTDVSCSRGQEEGLKATTILVSDVDGKGVAQKPGPLSWDTHARARAHTPAQAVERLEEYLGGGAWAAGVGCGRGCSLLAMTGAQGHDVWV